MSLCDRLLIQAESIRKNEMEYNEFKIIDDGLPKILLTSVEYRTWFNSVKVLLEHLPLDFALRNDLLQLIYNRDDTLESFDEITGILGAIKNSELSYSNQSNKETAQYDVFLSHANSDKLDYVNELYNSLSTLGINIFYDKKELSWGDNWKEKILEGTAKSEFSIIVISNNYFGREWTEKELNDFLQRQNKSGQKIILPLLYNITFKDMKEHYPKLEFIQSIKSTDFSNDKIALLLAKELIKRYKS